MKLNEKKKKKPSIVMYFKIILHYLVILSTIFYDKNDKYSSLLLRLILCNDKLQSFFFWQSFAKKGN
jgi:hypothetical protein